MDMRIVFLLLGCLMGFSTNFPLRKLFPTLQNIVTGKRGLPASLDVYSRIMEANKNTNEPMVQGDILMNIDRSAMNCTSCLWPISDDGTVNVPYKLSSKYGVQHIDLIKLAMQEFETLTCVRFVPWTTEEDFINILSSGGCGSLIGRIGGAQKIKLDINGCMYQGIIQHELQHALGFYHEQCRSDRDNYVRIMTQYISPENLINFEKLNTNNLGLEYDYKSVMHYARNAFSNTSGKDTIIPIPDPNVPIGQLYGLSNMDVSKIKKLYQCDDCSILLPDTSGTLNSTNFPSAYLDNAYCVWLMRTPSGQVSLQFNTFKVKFSPGCVTDYLKIYDGASRTSPLLLDRTCGKGPIPLMISSTKHMLIEFVGDLNVKGTGFKAKYNSVPCGGAFYAPEKNFTSPGYPDEYSPNMDCKWTITAPHGYQISISFSDFYLEIGLYCIYDYLKIYDGSTTNSPLMRTYCGPMTIPELVSTGNSILLQFHSDGSTQLRGFQASYTFV